MKNVAIIGSTGSIGRNALAVMREYTAQFRVAALIAGKNADLLATQIAEFQPPFAALADAEIAMQWRRENRFPAAQIFGGDDGIAECLQASGANLCVSAFGGISGLLPTLAAIDAGLDIALANKETLVAAGEIVIARARQKGVKILPVDSEHSAVWQCLAGRDWASVHRVILTASGGAFRDTPPEQLNAMTPAAALKHPTWSMGKKVTVDSATLANKALEVIEARFLFDLPYEKITVLIHPQSVLHGAVEFADGTFIAQLAAPDMRLPILYALNGGEHWAGATPRLTLGQLASLTFAAPDTAKYPLFNLGVAAGKQGGLAPAFFSAANEVSVNLFLAGKIQFPEIATRVEKCLAQTPAGEATLDNVLIAHREARQIVGE
jgi:1-deoxy-D-xylulose-5-phosphate reductoisomerase